MNKANETIIAAGAIVLIIIALATFLRNQSHLVEPAVRQLDSATLHQTDDANLVKHYPISLEADQSAGQAILIDQ